MERLAVLYASALFDLALDKGVTDDLLDQALLVRETLQDEQCQRILVHPHISAAEKQEFFRKAFAGQIHADLLGFLFLVADKNREPFLVPALTALVGMIERHKRIVTAKVLSAVEFDEKQAKALRGMLSEKLNKSVKLSLKVDPSVIGGPFILVDGYYIDWTVKKRLSDLTVHMKEGCGA
jgi:F-type H+-transporting ATPase subunit delta